MKTKAQELGEAIEKDRARRGVSQEDVAKAVGVTQQALSGWEAGASLPRSARLERLRVFFGPHSETGLVIRHIVPISHHGRDQVFTQRDVDLQLRQLKGTKPMGNLTAEQKQSGPPMSTDEPTAHVEQGLPTYGIKSFEERSIPSIEMRDALTRAAKGVQLARQVLDDAADQLDRALSKLKA